MVIIFGTMIAQSVEMTTKIFNLGVKCKVQIYYKVCLMAPQTFSIESIHIWHNGCLSLKMAIQVSYCQYDLESKGQGQTY